MSQTVSNSRKHSPIKLGALLLGALCAVETANAHDENSAYQMTVIRDAAHGGRVSAGRYDDAIARIKDSKVRPSERFFASNNLCVAYTKSGDLEKAREACNEAVRLATRKTLISRHAELTDRRYRALALSNRGVLRAIEGDVVLARQDFESALELRGGLSAPARNLAHLEESNA